MEQAIKIELNLNIKVSDRLIHKQIECKAIWNLNSIHLFLAVIIGINADFKDTITNYICTKASISII